jgi:hypothetical protein
MRVVTGVLLSVLSFTSSALAAAAAEPLGAGATLDWQESIAPGSSPTDVLPRFELRNAYRTLDDVGRLNTTTPRLDLAFSDQTLLRVDVPFGYVDPSDDDESAFGLSDVSVRAVGIPYADSWVTVATGIGFITDSATDDRIGEGKYRIVPSLAVSIAMPPFRSRLVPSYEHDYSMAGDDDRADIHRGTARLLLLTRWNDNLWTGVEPAVIVDLERDSDLSAGLEVEVGTLLANAFGLWVRPGIAAGDQRQYDLSLELGLRYLL